MCKEHWDLCREAVKDKGMWSLVARSGEEAMENITDELSGREPRFDPLMSLNNHYMGDALRNGGLYLMSVDMAANPTNEGHYCPLCEFKKHMPGFDAKVDVEQTADSMAAYAREQKLIPAVS